MSERELPLPDFGVHRQTTSADLNIPLPSPDTQIGIAETARRQAIAQAAPSTAPEEPTTAREVYERANAGFVVLNTANERGSIKCVVPNIRLLRFYKTHAEATEFVRRLMLDPEVTAAPAIVPANAPFLIPFSDAAALDPRHTLNKVALIGKRYAEFVKMRDEDFKRHVNEKRPGAEKASEYHRRKTHLMRQKLKKYHLGEVSSKLTASGARDLEAALKEAEAVLPSFGSGAGAGSMDPYREVGGSGDGAAAAMHSAAAVTPISAALEALPDLGAVAAPREPARLIAARDLPTEAPPTVWQGSLPAHWQPDAERRPRTADEWPLTYRDPHARFMIMAVIEDLTRPEDDPAYAEAAGTEPLIIVFGEAFDELDAAKAHLKKEIAPWCQDLQLDVVDMYNWLWPTEVDPDKLEEEHRTGQAGFTAELNLIMNQRKKTMAQAGEARAAAAARGIALPETNVNEVVPDVGAAMHTYGAGMRLSAPIQQFNADGSAVDDTTTSTELPEL